MANKKYYWLKLDRNFFKRHDVRIVEGMENGKDYILFYLKLLVESIDHEGMLRFNDLIPYDDKMLSVVTNTNVDVVRSAIKLFKELKLMEIYDDGTIYLNETQKMLGESTSTHRVNAYRERQKQLLLEQRNVTETLHETEIEKEIDIDKEKKKDIKKESRFTPPTLDDVKDYCLLRENKVDAEKWHDFYQSKGWMVGKNKMKDWKAAIRTWEKESSLKQTNGKVSEPEWMEGYIADLRKMEG